MTKSGRSFAKRSEARYEPDLYIWLGELIAPDADFELVATARNGISKLVDRAKERLRSTPS